MLVLIVVVGTFLSNRIRWVANDDADVLPVQFRKASVVFTERRAEDTALPIVGKRICPDHHFVRLVYPGERDRAGRSRRLVESER